MAANDKEVLVKADHVKVYFKGKKRGQTVKAVDDVSFEIYTLSLHDALPIYPPERLPPNRFKSPSAPRPIPTNRKISASAVFLTACLATKSNPRKGCSAPFPPDGRDAASAPE